MTPEVDPMAPWPRVALDRVARLRVLAEGLPGVAVEERVIDAPFDDLWGFVSDLERSAPAFDSDVSELRIVRQDGDRLWVRSRASRRFLGVWAPFRVELSPGWCLMVSRPQAYVVGMAAEPDGDRTRFAHLEGFTFSGRAMFRAVARPAHAISRWRHRYHVPRDLDRIEEIVTGEITRERGEGDDW